MAALVLLVVLLIPGLAAAQPASQQSPAAPGSQAAQPQETARQASPPLQPDPNFTLPVSLERIREKLAEQPAFEIPNDRPIFRIRIEEPYFRLPEFRSYLKEQPIPAPWGGYYHNEFLNMVTPRDVAASYSNSEQLQMMATGALFSLARMGVVSAVKGILHMRQEAEAERIRREVQEELEALKAANEAAARKKKGGDMDPAPQRQP